MGNVSQDHDSDASKMHRMMDLISENNRLRSENAVLKFKLSQMRAIENGMTVVVDFFDRGGNRYVVTNDGKTIEVYSADKGGVAK